LRLGKDTQINSNATVTVNGGTFELNAHNDSVGTVILDNSGSILNGGNTSKTLSATNFDFRNGAAASKLGGGSLTKSTGATVILSGNNAYTNGTLISAGLLQLGNGANTGLLGSGPVTNNAMLVLNRSDAFNLTNVISGSGSLTNLGGTPTLTGANTYGGGTTLNGGTLIVNNTSGSGTGSGAVTVNNSATLGGKGTISGPVTVLPGGTLSPGPTIATLTINNTLVLQGTTAMDINNANTPNSDQVAGVNNLTYGGTLTVNNLGPALTGSDVFKLFDAAHYAGAFAALVPAIPGTGMTWNTNMLTTDGTLRVVSSGPNPSRTNITYMVTGSNLTLSWPADHTGWSLQAQTNPPNSGLGTNWVVVGGSTATNQVTFTLDPTKGSVFFRLSLP